MFSFIKSKSDKLIQKHTDLFVTHLLSAYDYDGFEIIDLNFNTDKKIKFMRAKQLLSSNGYSISNIESVIDEVLKNYPTIQIITLKRPYTNYTQELHLPFFYNNGRFVLPSEFLHHTQYFTEHVLGYKLIDKSLIRFQYLEFDVRYLTQGIRPIIELNYRYNKSFPIIGETTHKAFMAQDSKSNSDSKDRVVEVFIKQHHDKNDQYLLDNEQVVFLFELWHRNELLKTMTIPAATGNMIVLLKKFLFPLNLDNEIYETLGIVPELSKSFIDSFDKDNQTLIEMIDI